MTPILKKGMRVTLMPKLLSYCMNHTGTTFNNAPFCYGIGTDMLREIKTAKGIGTVINTNSQAIYVRFSERSNHFFSFAYNEVGLAFTVNTLGNFPKKRKTKKGVS
jgi:hypothetical protein